MLTLHLLHVKLPREGIFGSLHFSEVSAFNHVRKTVRRLLSASVGSQLPSAQLTHTEKCRMLGWHILISFRIYHSIKTNMAYALVGLTISNNFISSQRNTWKKVTVTLARKGRDTLPSHIVKGVGSMVEWAKNEPASRVLSAQWEISLAKNKYFPLKKLHIYVLNKEV